MTIDVAALPRLHLKPGTRLYRLHRAVNGPWYFSGDGLGRFDPIASPGRGACYFAEEPLGAWVESFRTTMTLREDDVDMRVLTALELEDGIDVVDLTDRRSLAAGMSAAVTAGADYAESHDLASRLQGDVDGVRWRVRHDLAQALVGVALFGPRGGQRDDYLLATTRPISRDLIRAAEDAFGYRVVPLSAT